MIAGTHLRWWSPQTPYAKQNGGKYDFVIGEKMALPTDSQFFPELLKKSKKWGNKLLLQVIYTKKNVARIFCNAEYSKREIYC